MANVVKNHFDKLSTSYHLNFVGEKSGKTHEFSARGKLVSDMVAGKKGSLLDCCCGNGEITKSALRGGEFDSVVIVDISPEMLAIASSEMPESLKVEVVNEDIFSFKAVNDSRYDTVLCIGLIAHTGRLVQLLQHLATMLHESGEILLQSTLADHWGVKVERLISSKRYQASEGYAINYFNEEEISAAAQAAGFIVKDTRKYCLGIPFGDRISKSLNYKFEQTYEGFAGRRGSEAIFRLVRSHPLVSEDSV